MARNIVKEIRKATRKKFSAEEKIRIVLKGLWGEIPIFELARREGIAPSVYYRWSKASLEAGKNGLTRETHRDATSDEVRQLKADNDALKRALAVNSLIAAWASGSPNKAEEAPKDCEQTPAQSRPLGGPRPMGHRLRGWAGLADGDVPGGLHGKPGLRERHGD